MHQDESEEIVGKKKKHKVTPVTYEFAFTHNGAKKYEFLVKYTIENKQCVYQGITAYVNHKVYSIQRAIAGVGRRKLTAKVQDALERHTKLKVSAFDLPIALESK